MATTVFFDGFEPFAQYLARVWVAPFGMEYQKPLNAFLPILALEHKEHFSREKDSSGASWPPLAPSTIKRKGHDRILVEHGDLQRSLETVGGPNNIAATTGQGLLFGTSDPKAGFHQSGTRNMPARPPVGVSLARVNQLTEMIADSAVDQILNIV